MLAADKPWPPPTGVPMTAWGTGISPGKPILPEYPRPQMVRKEWLNLNGMWDYAISPKAATEAPAKYDGRILVPFPVESVLSQVAKKVDRNDRLWYRRKFEVPARWMGQRILLNFGAVNWEASVAINGKWVGRHTGGYDGFSLDITNALKPSGPQELVVSVHHPIVGGEPHGKQEVHTGYITYTAAAGIWQTVWLESVPMAHVDHLRMIADIDQGRLQLVAATGAIAAVGQTVEAIMLDGQKEVARASGFPGLPMSLAVPKAKLWWPETPFLYDLKIALKQDGKIIDAVDSYFGMRKISVGPDKKGVTRILLNNQFIFQNGLLDQGYWPDGIYTAPTDEALRFDVEMTRKLGYNMLRKHVKVEPDRWYYWTDKLGVLVWQDMPSAGEIAWDDYFSRYVRSGEFLPDPWGNYESELRRMVRGRWNHPSIVMWINFNEGWGLSMAPEAPRQPRRPAPGMVALEKRMVDAVRQEDPTRLIDPESGIGGGGKKPDGSGAGNDIFDFKLGDVLDYHAYAAETPKAERNRAAVFGEYGWAHLRDAAFSLIERSKDLTISGIVLVQLTDVENEENGALTYARAEKPAIPVEQTGIDLIHKMRRSGYPNYPGRDPRTARPDAAN
jgi:beta-galactosidase/beta-glucuronidase